MQSLQTEVMEGVQPPDEIQTEGVEKDRATVDEGAYYYCESLMGKKWRTRIGKRFPHRSLKFGDYDGLILSSVLNRPSNTISLHFF